MIAIPGLVPGIHHATNAEVGGYRDPSDKCQDDSYV